MSSTKFNKPLDTEFVGKVNEFDERVTALSEQIVNNRFKIVNNGNVVIGHAYLLFMEESTIANKYFTVLYDPTENNGNQHFGTVLDNGTNLFLCSADINLLNGTLSISNAKRINSNGSGRDNWSVSIRYIRTII